MRVRPPCAHKHSLEAGPVFQIRLEGGAHGQAVPTQVEVVLGRGCLNELVDLGKRVVGDDIDRR